MKLGLSILIPIYNKDVTRLVVDLQQQCEANLSSYEIICLDDHSESKYDNIHHALNTLEGVIYLRLDKNIGRSAIRNKLSNHSQYAYMLFLDCDSLIVSKSFIKDYWRNVNAHKSEISLVVYGGTRYQENTPPEHNLIHWNYGRKIESQAANIRQHDPYLHFKSNNFLITRALFDCTQFDETIRGYGYEDILLGQRLKDVGAKMLHIDNEVLHDGIEDNVVYLSKIETAVDNLLQLVREGKITQGRLIAWGNFLKRWHLIGLINFCSKPLSIILKKLLLLFPSQVFLLQSYKLILFSKRDIQK